MTIEEAKKLYQSIADASGDDEVAHGLEDEFRELVLKEVTNGNPDSLELAKIALSASEIKFLRWCA